jgi:site-specific recombinase XerD
MATVKAILNTRYQSKDKTFPIVIRLIVGKEQKNHSIGYKVLETSFVDGYVSKKHPEANEINAVIDSELSKAKHYLADCKIKGIPIDLDLAFKQIKSHSFTAYLQKRADQYGARNMVVMERKTRRFRTEFLEHFVREVYFSDLTTDNISAFDAYLINLPNSANTRIKKFEHLKKFFKAAKRDGLTSGENPFEYKITAQPVKKIKLTREQLNKLEDLQLKPGMERLARDLFLFSYYSKAQRFETCITMEKKSVIDGRLEFQANKGKKFFSVEIHPKLSAIIDRYIINDTDTIFGRNKIPIEDLRKKHKQYISFVGSENANINRSLKTVAKLAEINIDLKMHQARHSLAYHLKEHKAGAGVIKDVLGHSDTRTTERYLDSLDDRVLDKAVNDVYYDH